MAFFLAMTVYPEVQKTAQDELDRVVGHGVLPDFGHKSELPYLEALLKELLRWIQVIPLGMCLGLYPSIAANVYIAPSHSASHHRR